KCGRMLCPIASWPVKNLCAKVWETIATPRDSSASVASKVRPAIPVAFVLPIACTNVGIYCSHLKGTPSVFFHTGVKIYFFFTSVKHARSDSWRKKGRTHEGSIERTQESSEPALVHEGIGGDRRGRGVVT